MTTTAIPKDLRKLIAREAPGTTVEWTAKSHLRLLVPGGGIVIASGTPSDTNSVRALRAELRRAVRRANA